MVAHKHEKETQDRRKQRLHKDKEAVGYLGELKPDHALKKVQIVELREKRLEPVIVVGVRQTEPTVIEMFLALHKHEKEIQALEIQHRILQQQLAVEEGTLELGCEQVSIF